MGSKKRNTIKARIRARKVTLSYFYWRIFVLRLAENESLLGSIIETSRGLEMVHDTTQDDTPEEQRELARHLQHMFGEDTKEDISYVCSYYFDEWDIDSIDMDYVFRLAEWFDTYYPVVAQAVNEHTTTFGFEQMDPMDQSLFVLAYEENILIQTPKEIIINEIVELAKRYGDSGSPKLLHGIVHHLLINEPKNNRTASSDTEVDTDNKPLTQDT